MTAVNTQLFIRIEKLQLNKFSKARPIFSTLSKCGDSGNRFPGSTSIILDSDMKASEKLVSVVVDPDLGVDGQTLKDF